MGHPAQDHRVRGAASRSVRHQHILASALALLLTAAILLAGRLWAGVLERQLIHALAPQEFTLKITGSALQREAFRHPDLLVIYGSSEIMALGGGPYAAAEFFRTRPTGFATFVVGHPGVTSLHIIQDLAAIGSDLRGKKVVISFTPSMFMAPMVGQEEYAASFSRLHANELAFSGQISLALKTRAARRMLQYPGTLEQDPLLRFALEKLADPSLLNRGLYFAAWPLGRLQILVLRLQDHWESLRLIRHWRQRPAEAPHPAPVDWAALKIQVEEEQQHQADNNPYGFDNRKWQKYLRAAVASGEYVSTDARFLQALQASEEWNDLDMLLSTLRELGARPLILSRPLNGPFLDAMGVSARARQVYYERLQRAVEPYDAPLIDFRDHDEDKYFSTDPWSHPGWKGWLYVDEALDGFFHGTLR